MKLTQVLGQLNQIEKSKFVNVIDRIFQAADDKDKKLAATVSRIDGQLKTATSNEITQLFNAVRSHFLFDLKENLAMSGAELSLLIKILSRDGNSVSRQSWIETLFLREHERLNKRSKELLNEINDASNNSSSLTVRSKYLQIYKDCFEVAYRNDEKFNREAKVSQDERLILNCLASHLELTREETSALENLICPTSDKGLEDMMTKLRDYGVVFISKRQGKVFVPDEIVKMLNEIQDKVLADKHQIRIFRSLSDPELSNISKAHGAPIRGVSREDKISHALQLGIPIQAILAKDIHDQGATQNQRKERIKVMLDDLELNVEKLGSTLEERIEILVDALNNAESEEFDSLSVSGFKDLLDCLSDTKPSISQRLQDTFEIEPVETIDTELLRALSISPVDILYAYTNDEIKVLRNNMSLPKKINPRTAILESFASATDKLVENYVSLAARDLKALDAAGIQIKEAELGAKFEEVTRVLLEQLGLDVDEDLRKDINTAKDKADIIISLTDDDVIVGEAKSFKNGEFAKYSSTSRQVKAYAARCESQGKRVMQVLIVAPSFSSDFISSAEMDTDINISLLEAQGLKKIVDAFKARRNPKFSDKLLTKGGLLKSDLIAKSI